MLYSVRPRLHRLLDWTMQENLTASRRVTSLGTCSRTANGQTRPGRRENKQQQQGGMKKRECGGVKKARLLLKGPESSQHRTFLNLRRLGQDCELTVKSGCARIDCFAETGAQNWNNGPLRIEKQPQCGSHSWGRSGAAPVWLRILEAPVGLPAYCDTSEVLKHCSL